ncbi:HNH endonuclease [Brevibacterium sp. ACRRH]|uniref:HNH endonuclease signature motif containing protein n=1 Tax=Brevibacterium sp. ACRRH TaxID=2918183 RepID=UPI001EF63308|nr:HNH endonuclease signature motif containing protein [Brevibacterium sp. ACRRH]MCG7298618.1 HNH endonuclease [Brevibacterium sp. ACRRH]
MTSPNGEVSEVRVGDLGRVEVDDDRLMDQLTLDLITGAKPSTTLRARVIPTGKQAPIKVTYTKPEGPSTDASGSGDADGSVWADRCEAKQAEDVYELELCVSMPEKEEWLKSQASINLTVPVLHFLMNNPPPGTEGIPEEQRSKRQRFGKDPGPDEHRPGPEQQDPGRHETEDRQSGRIHESRKQRTEEQVFEHQGGSAPPGVGDPPGDGSGSEFDFGLPVKVDPGAHAPVMMNGRVQLDAKTADEVIAQAKWVYRMFTDPETGVVLESTPTKYYIPAALKRMVEARHPDCSVPWCAVPARVCEKDHIEPFNHQDPESGGLTVMENLHPLCKRHHQLKTQKRLRVDRMDDGSLACVFPRVGAMLVYPPESRINQYQYERLIEYFDTGDQDISHTINNYLATEQASTHSQVPNPETPAQTDRGTGGQTAGVSFGYDPAVADEYAVAGQVFNGDTRPWEPSEEPPPF